MRKAEDIIVNYPGESDGFQTTYTYKECIQMINEARKEAIEECAKRAKIVHYQPSYFLSREGALSQQQRDFVDKNSILNLIEELK